MPTPRPARRSPSPAPSPAPSTVACYLAYALLGWIFSSLGAVLPDLLEERGSLAGIYPSLPGVGLVVLGLIGSIGRSGGSGRGRAGRPLQQVVAAGSLAAIAGLLLMIAAPPPPVSLAGAVLLGFAAAALIRLIPAALAARYPGRSVAVLTRGNAWSSLASILGPLTVGTATWVGLGWRFGLLAVPVACIVVLVALIRMDDRPSAQAGPSQAGPSQAGPSQAGPSEGGTTTSASTEAAGAAVAGSGGRWRWAWLALTLSIMVEFAFVYFAATYLREEVGMSPAGSAAGAAAFAVGMAAGRFGAGSLPWYAGRRFRWHLALLTTGFVLMWALPTPVTAVAGIAVAGLGTALLYPIGIDRLLRCFPSTPSVGASRGGLASGLALLASPALLGSLRAEVGIQLAYLSVPVLLGALALVDTRAGTPGVAVSATGGNQTPTPEAPVRG